MDGSDRSFIGCIRQHCTVQGPRRKATLTSLGPRSVAPSCAVRRVAKTFMHAIKWGIIVSSVLAYGVDAFLLKPLYSYPKPCSLSRQAQETSTDLQQQTLTSFLGSYAKDPDLLLVLSAISTAIKQISHEVRRASVSAKTGSAGSVNISGDKVKKLDVIANDVMKRALISCGKVSVLASEEEDVPVRVQVTEQGASGGYCVVYDPLDGSSNVDAAIPTGTIFGVFRCPTQEPNEEEALQAVLQAGRKQVAAGYALFSGATILMLTLGEGSGAHAFTLDTHIGEFVLTQYGVKIPRRGSSYSLNEAREMDWPDGLRRYITDLKKGEGQTRTHYDLVYVCSLVADAHWVIVRGGWCANPRSHLRLIYEGNPMSLVFEEAGGLGSTGRAAILDVHPHAVHQRLPVFLGSHDDIRELETYGDVQQEHNPGYAV